MTPAPPTRPVQPLRRWLVRAMVGVVVLFGVMQLVPYGRSHDNPAVIAEPAWPSAHAERLARAACYDCHSNETVWPWYSNVAPMSWLVQKDVDDGRRAVNFSDWTAAGASHDADELHDAVEGGSMPPRQYELIHSAARLSAADRAVLVAALRDVENQAPGEDGNHRGRG